MSLPQLFPARRLAAPLLAAALLAAPAAAAWAQAPAEPRTDEPAAQAGTEAQAETEAAPPTEAPEADEARSGVFFPETFTLSNGMQVVVVTNRRMPVVTHMVWYKVGAADEAVGDSGIAHFLEHLMFKGTDTVPAGDFSEVVARHGGNDNAFTSWDYTGYFQNVARDRLEMVMEMEADRMANLRLTDEEVLPERAVVIEERRQRTDNEPGSRLAEQANASLFVHHPYGRPIIGWESELFEMTREDAEAFYETWYAPNNAVLVVAGDIDAQELRPLAERTYGQIEPRPVPPRVRVSEPPLEAERRVILRDPEVRQPAYRRLFKAPSYNAGETRHAYPLQVLSEILGGGTTSRLYRELVAEKRLATGAGTGYSGTALDLGVFGIYLNPTPGTGIEELEAAMEDVVARLLADGVTAEEVETAKRRLERQAVFARDSLSGPAYSFGTALTTGGTVEDVEVWPERIAAVTAEQVNAAARAVLGQSGFVVGLLLPAEEEAAASAPAATPATPAPTAAPAASAPAPGPEAPIPHGEEVLQ
ncbi:pitrilysin family protein [Arenibaculum sp.]|uniref:M16 family metallopeptidase n=1 Tax=Arenibaculum sp. TaxID=2865862 RepID=UPI002E12D1AC|nr:pitrilysin family protein [Arenibaculum sp.]